MTHASPRFLRRARGRVPALVALAFSLALVTGLATAGTASAWSWNDDGAIQKVQVPSPAMGHDIPVSILSGGPGAPALYMLDGLRARDDWSGWDMETNAFDKFRGTGTTVVMPIGGESSWYTNWNQPDNGKNYQWETFLTEELPAYLNANYGTPYSGNGIVGLSMGGSAALDLAAYHKPYFSFAGSFSGYLHNAMPGMPLSIGLGMLDAGSFNAGNMYGSVSSANPEWRAHDPFVIAPKLRGLSLYISAGSALPDPDPDFGDNPQTLVDYYNELNGMGLEGLALLNTKIFQMRLDSLGIPATYDFPPVGLHAWNNWSKRLDNADRKSVV